MTCIAVTRHIHFFSTGGMKTAKWSCRKAVCCSKCFLLRNWHYFGKGSWP